MGPIDGEDESPYINVYRYDGEYSETAPCGTLIPSKPITAQDFSSRQFNISDVAVLGNRIYILEHKRGVFSFEYWANQI